MLFVKLSATILWKKHVYIYLESDGNLVSSSPVIGQKQRNMLQGVINRSLPFRVDLISRFLSKTAKTAKFYPREI